MRLRTRREFGGQLLKRIRCPHVSLLDAPAQSAFDVREQGEVVDLLIADLALQRGNAHDLDACHAPDPQEWHGSH